MDEFAPSAVRDVYVIVRDGDSVLLLLRTGTGYKDGEWGPPAGKVERDESYLAGAVRELEEEVGVTDPIYIRAGRVDEGDVLEGIYQRASWSNEGDRAFIEANRNIVVLGRGPLADGRMRVAELDGRVVGFATTLPADDYLELEDLFVDPDWMRRGVASALIVDAAAVARAEGKARIEVSGNGHALAFYESAGFVEVAMVESAGGPVHRMHLSV